MLGDVAAGSFGFWGVVGMLLRLYRFALGVRFLCFCKESRRKESSPKEPALRSRFLRYPPEGWGICAFEAQMRGPNEICLNPPAFGRSRTKAGGFVRFGCPSDELLWDSFTEGAKPLTDSGDLAGGGSGMRVNWGLAVCLVLSAVSFPSLPPRGRGTTKWWKELYGTND